MIIDFLKALKCNGVWQLNGDGSLCWAELQFLCPKRLKKHALYKDGLPIYIVLSKLNEHKPVL